MNVLAAARYIFRKYPDLKDKYPFWQILSYFDQYSDNLVIAESDEKIVGVALFYMIDDDALSDLILGRLDVSNSEHVDYLLNNSGDNLHFAFCAAESVSPILKGLKKTISGKSPKTVSWFRDINNIRFITLNKEEELCQSPA